MYRINTPADVANTGRVRIDTGDGVTVEMPVTPAPAPYASGVRQINGSISSGWTTATDGARILREGNEVTLYVDLYRVGELTSSFAAVVDIPAGFRPMGVGYQSPAKVTSGPSGWWEMSQNNLRIRDLTGPITDGARIRNTIKWTTLDTPPPNLPGLPA